MTLPDRQNPALSRARIATSAIGCGTLSGVAEALGFEPLRPRPRWVAKGWIVERRF
jgi:hypothetical protein